MAFDFLGTYTAVQLDELERFVNERLLDADLQANHLVAEAERYRKVKINLELALSNMEVLVDEDSQLSFFRTEKELKNNTGKFEKVTYMNKLFEQSFMRQDTGAPHIFDDYKVGFLVNKLKIPYIQEIKQREKLEKKIRQCSDYIEQLEELRMLKVYAKTESLQLLNAIKEQNAIIESKITSYDISTTSPTEAGTTQ